MDICLHALSVDAPNALYVGDHPLDVLCAKKAGMRVAWLCGKDRRLPGYIP